MKRMSSNILLSLVIVACTASAQDCELTEKLKDLKEQAINVFNDQVTKAQAKVEAMLQNIHNVPAHADTIANQVTAQVGNTVDKTIVPVAKSNIVKRSTQAVIDSVRSAKNGLVSQTTRTGHALSSACTRSKNSVVDSIVSAKNYIVAHPIKFTAMVTTVATASGTLGYFAYNYINQEKVEEVSAIQE